MEIERLQHGFGEALTYDALFAHWKITCQTFNDAFVREGLPLKMDWRHLTTEEVDRLIDRPDGHFLQRFITDSAQGKKVHGVMHNTQIFTLVEAIKNIYHGADLVLILGAMMCGKTGTANGCDLMGPIFYLLKGIRYLPFHLLPPRKATGAQTSNELQMWYALYQDLRIHRTDTDKVVPLKLYKPTASAPARPVFAPDGSLSLLMYKSRVLRERLAAHIREVFGRPLGDTFSYLIRRRTRKDISTVQRMCQAAYRDGFSLIFVADEPHWGSADNGVQSRMLHVMEDMQQVAGNHLLVVLDATPFEIANAAKFSVVNHRLGANYCGPNCWGGRVLDSSVETRDVHLHVTSEFGAEMGVADFALFNRRAYSDATAFAKWLRDHNKRSLTPLKLRHSTYQARMRAAMKQMIEQLVLHPQEKRTRGIALRLLKSNQPSKQLLKDCNLSPKIKVIHYMDVGGQKSVEEAIEDATPNDEQYVILVTGAARMADFFPQHCTHMIDFTETIATHPALMQGSYGRMTGYGEPRHVVMTERSIRFIRTYLASSGRLTMSLGPNATRPSSASPGRPHMNERLGCRADDPAMAFPKIKRAISKLQSSVIDLLPYNGGKLTSIADAMPDKFPDGWVPFWWLFNEVVLAEMELHWETLFPCAEQPHILRPGTVQLGQNGRELYIERLKGRPGYGKVGVRNKITYDEQPYTSPNQDVKGKYTALRSNKTGRAGTDNTARGDIVGGVQPQLWLKPNAWRRKWELEVIVFRLEFGVRGGRNDPTEILAAQRNHYRKHHSAEQQEEILRRDRHKGEARKGSK